MRVLVVSEESTSIWKRKCAELNIGNHAQFICTPFNSKPSMSEFKKLIRFVCDKVEADDIQLVIFDTLSHLLPCQDENDSAAVETALAPIRAIPKAGAAVLMVHHFRKSGGQFGAGIRGSSVFGAFTDVNIELSRMPGDTGDDTRRTLRATSRYEETPAEVVIEKRGADYVEVGTTADARRLDDISVIREILIAGPEGGMKQNEIKAAWPTDDHAPKRPCDTALFNLLKSGSERTIPVWNKSKSSKRGGAIFYSFIHPKGDIVNERNDEIAPNLSFIHNPLLSVKVRKNGESDQYGTKNGNSRITQNGLCETTKNGTTMNGYSDAYSEEAPF